MKKREFINKEIDNHYLLTDKSVIANLSQHYFNSNLHNGGPEDKKWKMHIRRECNNTTLENLENIIKFTGTSDESFNDESIENIKKQLTNISVSVRKGFMEYHNIINKYISNYHLQTAKKSHPFKFSKFY